MPGYSIDRARLEALPSEEIQRILREERDDYTPEAIIIFQEILQSRGIGAGENQRDRQGLSSKGEFLSSQDISSEVLIRNPRDGVILLNKLLKGLLDGTMEPQVVHVGSQVITNILHAMEQEFLTGSEEES